MPKIARELSALEVRRLTHPGSGGNRTFAIGGVAGLYLQITPGGGRSWLLRYVVEGNRYSMGLGAYPEVSLAAARDYARSARAEIREGGNPLLSRRAARSTTASEIQKAMTFEDATDGCLAVRLEGLKNKKHKKQWRTSLSTYAFPKFGHKKVLDVDIDDVKSALEPIWSGKTETATRLRARIEAVISWAQIELKSPGPNPARWKNNLDAVLPRPSRVQKRANWPAVSLSDAARFWADLRNRCGMAPCALRFQALTAARSGAVRFATWDEIDLDTKLWRITAGREASKLDEEAAQVHTVPLSSTALRLLETVPREHNQRLVFWGTRGGALSDMSISAVMRRMNETDIKNGGTGYLDQRSARPAVPHGLRSTFKDWAIELTDYPNEMSEIALAHQVGSAVERAYRRSTMIEKRRSMMEDWAEFLESTTT